MRAVCVADIHGDIQSLVRLRNSLSDKDIDFVFILGDFSRGYRDEAENRADIDMALETLSGFTVRAIPGNCDQRMSVDTFRQRGVNLHETVMKLPEANIIGFGGSNPTPFDTPFEYGEAEMGQALKSLYDMADMSLPTVVISHAPPRGTRCDAIESGAHVGSQALREFIETAHPAMVICSHIHESGGGMDVIGRTQVYNVGRLSEGRALLLKVEEEVSAAPYLG